MANDTNGRSSTDLAESTLRHVTESLQLRDATLSRREEELWQRTQRFVEDVAELQQQERASAVAREDRLLSHIDSLVTLLQQAQPSATPVPTPPAPYGVQATDPIADLAAASDAASSDTPVSTPEPAAARSSGQPSEPAAIVANAMNMVREGADVLEDIDFTSSSEAAIAPSPGTPSLGLDSAVSTASEPAASPRDAVAARATQAASMGGALAFAAAANAGAGASEDHEVEVQKAAPDGPPPLLNIGDDDICWVARLHESLLAAGYYCGEEDEEDFYFGNGTQNAVMTFQACSGLPETGTVDDATWQALPRAWSASATQASNSIGSATPSATPTKSATSSTPKALKSVPTSPEALSTPNVPLADAAEMFGGLFEGLNVTSSAQGLESDASSLGPSPSNTWGAPGSAPMMSGHKPYSEWPTLREGDGDRAVHSLQVKLAEAGFHAAEDDTKWWQFGPTTLSALQTFQACNGLPESGVCDPNTWKALLGANATPADITSVFSGDSDDEDLEHQEGRVYLLGEQRWARKI